MTVLDEDDESIPVEVMTLETLLAAGYSESDAAFRMAVANGEVEGCCVDVTADEILARIKSAPLDERKWTAEEMGEWQRGRARMAAGEPSVKADELRAIIANAPVREMRLDDETWAKLKAARAAVCGVEDEK